MKLLLLTNKSPWPPKDGGSSATFYMIKMLAAKGVSVTVLSFNTLKHHADTGNIPGTFASFHFVDIDSRIKPLRLFLNLLFSSSPYTLTRFRNSSFSEKLEGLLKSEFDIVQIEGLAMAFYLPLIREHSSARVIFRPHNVENIIWTQLADEENNILKKLYFTITARKTKRIETDICVRFDAVVAITQKDREWFTKNGCNKPVIVTSPSPDTGETINADQIPLSVGFIGALDWRPNINGLRWMVKEVWPRVITAHPGAFFYIAGRNPGREIKKICNTRNIIFMGETESSAKFMQDKMVIVAPLFSGSGVRIKILEGMSLGKCIVATPVAADGIICEDRKNIFIAEVAACFADCITELLNDESLRTETGHNALENVRKNYNTLASAEELIKFYTRNA